MSPWRSQLARPANPTVATPQGAAKTTKNTDRLFPFAVIEPPRQSRLFAASRHANQRQKPQKPYGGQCVLDCLVSLRHECGEQLRKARPRALNFVSEKIREPGTQPGQEGWQVTGEASYDHWQPSSWAQWRAESYVPSLEEKAEVSALCKVRLASGPGCSATTPRATSLQR